MKRFLRWDLIVVAVLGVAVGLAIPSLRYKSQSLNECLIEHMKGMPGPMFTTVYEYCQDEKKAELTDKQVGLPDDWQPVKRDQLEK